MKRVMVIAGARPNFVKVAPLMRELRRHPDTFAPCLVHTGQHYDIAMSEVFFRELEIPAPDVNLEVGSASHAVQTANVMIAFEQVCLERQPDWVVVVGDVNSTMACTLVCAKLGIRVAHVEAGLRSFDRTMPEEVNRLVTDALADLLLTPSADADENLAREGVPPTRIRRVGNIMIDTLVANLDKAERSSVSQQQDLGQGAFIYVTLHRPSNVDTKAILATIMDQLQQLARRTPVFFPLHPRTRKMLDTFGLLSGAATTLKLVDPVGYHDSLWLSKHAVAVVTDSGGLQEETTFLGTPCLTLRPNTERPVTITEGTNRLTDPEHLAQHVQAILTGEHRSGRCPELWDGKTAGRIVSCLD